MKKSDMLDVGVCCAVFTSIFFLCEKVTFGVLPQNFSFFFSTDTNIFGSTIFYLDTKFLLTLLLNDVQMLANCICKQSTHYKEDRSELIQKVIIFLIYIYILSDIYIYIVSRFQHGLFIIEKLDSRG